MSLLLLYHGGPIGPVEGSVELAETNDTLAGLAALDILTVLAAVEANDIATAAGMLTVTASAFITEADDAVVSSATLTVASALMITEGNDTPTASGAVNIVGSLAAIEDNDAFIADGAIGIEGDFASTEEDDALSTSALMPIWYPRRGGDDDWARYERRQIEWELQLRRIIDRSWRIANGEIDPITFKPVPPADYSAVIDELINQALTIDQARVEAFMAEQGRAQEEEAISILLLAA